MMEAEQLLRRYLDGELGPEEEREALHLFAEDAGLRDMLRFERQLKAQAPGLVAPARVPEGFSDRVMARITAEEPVRPKAREEASRRPIREWLRWLWQPRPMQLRPAGLLAALILLLAIPLITFNKGGAPKPDLQQLARSTSVQNLKKTEDKVMLRFVFFDTGADSMAVAGDFSNWEPISMTRKKVNGKNVWTGMVPMSRGEHHYMFLKNGRDWMTDPLAPIQREDGFGNKNAVIFL